MNKIGKLVDGYEIKEREFHSDILSDQQLALRFPINRVVPDGEHRLLSLFSGCGGMDIGFEGGFIANIKSIGSEEWIEKKLNKDWALLKKTRFNTIFANDILPEARTAWLGYMSRFDLDEEVYNSESIVELVKQHKAGIDVFPEDIDIVTGGFPCQDFSVAGKRKGFDSGVNHLGKKKSVDEPTEETRGKLYFWMKEVIEITKPKVFIAENVKGLVNLGNVKDIIQRDFASAGGNGYYVLTPQVLHAGNYGVPETRERVFFHRIKKGCDKA